MTTEKDREILMQQQTDELAALVLTTLLQNGHTLREVDEVVQTGAGVWTIKMLNGDEFDVELKVVVH